MPKKNTVANRHAPISGKLTPDVIERICLNYEQGGTVNEACHKELVSSVAFHKAKSKSPELQARWALAEQLNTCHLEERALTLALQSDVRSPTMLIFMLKARRPERYRDNVAVQHSGSVEFAGAFAEAMQRAVGSSQTSRSSDEVH